MRNSKMRDEIHLDYAYWIAQFAYWCKKNKYFDAIVLFGSVACGTQTAKSDVDMIFIVKEDVNIFGRAYLEFKSGLMREIKKAPVQFDVYFLENIKPNLLAEDLEWVNIRKFYIRVLSAGLIYDGLFFHKKAIESLVIRQYIAKIKSILLTNGIKY